MPKENELRKLLQAIAEKQPPQLQESAKEDVTLILEKGVKSFDEMIALLNDAAATAETRSRIFWFLGQIKGKKSLSVLMEFFEKEADEKAIWEIAKSLSLLETKVPVKPICSTVTSGKPSSRRAAAAYLLGRLRDRAVTDCLIHVLCNLGEDEIVRGHAAEALGAQKDGKAFDSLLRNLSDNSVSVRFWAAFALGELGDQRAIPSLRTLSETDNSILEGWWAIKKEALDAIQKITKSEEIYGNF